MGRACVYDSDEADSATDSRHPPISFRLFLIQKFILVRGRFEQFSASPVCGSTQERCEDLCWTGDAETR